MVKETEIIQELDTLQQEELELRQAYTYEFELIARKRQDLLSELKSCCSKATPHTTNGRARAVTQQSDASEDDFAIILDLNAHTLKLRLRPEDNSALQLGSLSGLGSMRMKVMVWMLQNRGNSISYETAPRVYGHPTNICEPGTFAQTIKLLRNALGGRGRANPYILTVPNSEPGKRTHGCSYVMNPAYRYLVTRNSKSFESDP